MISKKLLCHSIIAKKKTGIDADRNETFELFEIDNVRISTTRARNKDSYGFTSSDNLVLISDNNSTRPIDFVPIVGMKILFEEREYTINSVKPCYGLSNKIHHYVSGLV